MRKKRKLVTFDWAMKKILRSKANFKVLEGFLTELLGKDVVIQEKEAVIQEKDQKIETAEQLLISAGFLEQEARVKLEIKVK